MKKTKIVIVGLVATVIFSSCYNKKTRFDCTEEMAREFSQIVSDWKYGKLSFEEKKQREIENQERTKKCFETLQ